MRRISNPEEPMLNLHLINKNPEDTCILCFGEIDVRCHVAPILEHRSISTETFLFGMAENYFTKITSANTNNSKLVVMSLPPPAIQGKIKSTDFPIRGSETQRVTWTLLLNNFLKELCEKYEVTFLNVYHPIANKKGLLDLPYTKDFVHIHAPDKINSILTHLAIL